MSDDKKPDEAFDRPSRLPGFNLPPPAQDKAAGTRGGSEPSFPAMPSSLDVPDAPEVKVTLPPRPDAPQKGAVAPGAYHKLAVSATAASSFITPIVVLGVGGWYLDQKMHNQPALLGFVGTLLGFVVGIIALMRVIKQLSN